MKIFIQIPALPNNEFKVSAIKAIRNMSHPPLPFGGVKTMVETPGWHRIPNNMVEPLGMTKTDLRDYMERRSMDYETDVNAIYNYGGHIAFHLNNTEPGSHRSPEPEDITRQIHAAVVHELKHYLMSAIDLREYKMAKFLIDQIANYDKE